MSCPQEDTLRSSLQASQLFDECASFSETANRIRTNHDGFKTMQSVKTVLQSFVIFMVFLQCAANETPEPPGSSLAKYVLAFSRPGAFKEIHAVFGEELSITTPCPSGDEGLECRQEEAGRVYDDCPGGDCEACIGCNHSNLWPRCCQENALCCSNLARACQTCEPTDLQSFCTKNFKRCFRK